MIDLIEQYNNYIKSHIIENSDNIRICKDILCAIKGSANRYSNIIDANSNNTRFIYHDHHIVNGYYYVSDALYIENKNIKNNDRSLYHIDHTKVVYGDVTRELLDKFNSVYIKDKNYIAIDKHRNKRIYYPEIFGPTASEMADYIDIIYYRLKIKVQPIDSNEMK